ncbi:uncharacterized protein [Ptychodera flava]|uniref:uncharacterized protein n=1 Tax=Ptychodera flava TaxID=63121 RepID=UPI00396A00D4
MEPTEVKVIVYGARNLQGKKSGRCKTSVIFGIGDDKYRTAVINSSNPDWNEESVFEIQGTYDPLVFTVRDKQDILGELTIPIAAIPHRCLGRRRTEDLQPHRRCPNPVGQLIYDCWVAKSRKTSKASPGKDETQVDRTTLKGSLSGTLTWMRGTLLGSPSVTKKTPSFNYNRRGSRSVSDIAGLFEDEMNQTLLLKTSSHQDIRERAVSEPSASGESIADNRPEISGLSPREGPVDGGTKITIRGRNLGESEDDIVKFTICGADCLANVEYDSPNKIRCTTTQWKVCSGPVLIETRSGGLGISLVRFEFVDADTLTRKMSSERELESEGESPKGFFGFLFRDQKKDDYLGKNETFDNTSDNVHDEIQRLRKTVRDLKEENRNMRKYINSLLTKVMEKCPEILEHDLEIA